MGTLEDQLKQWKKKTDVDKASKPPPPPASRRAQKKKPLLQTIRREEPPKPAPPPPPPLSDAELFAAAVDGVSADAVLDKFSAAPAVKVKGQTLQPSAPKSDEQLFAEFVGAVQPKTAPPKKR